MWTDATVFLWPAFGRRLDVGGAAFWPAAWGRALSDPLRWVLEAAGVGYLVWLWVKSGLSMAANRATLLGSGRLSA